VRDLVVDVALEQPELTPRELAWHLTDSHEYFISESSVYRTLKAHDLVTRIRKQNKGPDTIIASDPSFSGSATFHRKVRLNFKRPLLAEGV
jgi:hypothetical protein